MTSFLMHRLDKEPMTAEQLIEYAAKSLGPVFDATGEVLPMYHWINAAGEHSVIGAPFHNQQEKEQMLAFMRALFKEDGAVAYVFVCEAWTAFAATDQEARAMAGHVKDQPNRREVLMFAAEDCNGHVQGHQEIIRSPLTGKAYLGSLTMIRPEGLEGRMVGLLPNQKGALQ